MTLQFLPLQIWAHKEIFNIIPKLCFSNSQHTRLQHQKGRENHVCQFHYLFGAIVCRDHLSFLEAAFTIYYFSRIFYYPVSAISKRYCFANGIFLFCFLLMKIRLRAGECWCRCEALCRPGPAASCFVRDQAAAHKSCWGNTNFILKIQPSNQAGWLDCECESGWLGLALLFTIIFHRFLSIGRVAMPRRYEL